MSFTSETYCGHNFTTLDGLEFDGFVTTPVVAPIGHCRIYFNKSTGKLMYSENGNPYKNFMSTEDAVILALAAKAVVVSRVLDENVLAGRFVTATSGTNIAYGQYNVAEKAKLLGLSLEEGVTGEEINVLLFGNYTDASMDFALNKPLYLQSDGQISETPPTSGYRAIAAYSNGTGSIFVKIEEPVEI